MQTSARRTALVLAMLPALVAAGDEWTPGQQKSGLALAALVAADWAQTRNIARHPDQWHETNPLLGKHPTTPAVDRHFLIGSALGYLLLDALPTAYRDAALSAGIVIQASCVANNLRLGIGINF